MDDWLTTSDARTTAANEEEPVHSGLTIEMLAEGDADDAQHGLDELLAEVEVRLPVDDVQFADDVVKQNLDELLLLFIGIHGQTHGKELMSDVTHVSGSHLSPGTVYPILHELEETGVLSMHENVRTKEYAIADDQVVRERLERSMVQHVAFGLFVNAFLSRY